MNDPGLDEPIVDAASQARDEVEQSRGHDEDSKEADAFQPDDKALPASLPTRWWYCSTAFPLMAGTFGPMANAFSVNALVENWRVAIPPGGTEEHGIDIKDPRWLIAINGVSLALALIANLSLLLNMAKRLRFEIAQPITIFGFWSASVLLISLLGYAQTENFRADGVKDQALTQAFYYAIWAASLYQIISYLMCITVWGAYRGSYSKDFELTVAQRTLMLQTISFLVYMEVGALVYSHTEGWKYLDAVYFMDYTLLTVGIGNLAPTSHLGRSLLFPIAVGGIITIGLVVSSIRSMILERGAEKMSARLTEKIRRRVVKQIDSLDTRGKYKRNPIFELKRDRVEDLVEKPKNDHIGELKRRKQEFEAMRQVQEMALREKRYVSLVFSATVFALLWFVGAAVFKATERTQHWSYFDSLYFSYTSIVTIGYGDLFPQSNSGKAFFVFWSLLAVPGLTILISNMGDTVVKGVKDVTIWLGEISVLPSNETRMRDRLQTAAQRTALGRIGLLKPKPDAEEGLSKAQEVDNDWANFREMHPGLVQVFGNDDHPPVDLKDLQVLNRLADAWAEAEHEDELLAKKQHDDRSQAEHHYRHLLIRHIPKIYADTKARPAKKYTYGEWTFYLKLIGEDESDSKRHRHAIPKQRAHSRHHRNASRAAHEETQDSETAAPKTDPSNAADIKEKWSWISHKSPLMQGQDEAEWILQKLFEQLEESFRVQLHSSHVDRSNQFSNVLNWTNDQPISEHDAETVHE